MSRNEDNPAEEASSKASSKPTAVLTDKATNDNSTESTVSLSRSKSAQLGLSTGDLVLVIVYKSFFCKLL
jgi:hypothetical protein